MALFVALLLVLAALIIKDIVTGYRVMVSVYFSGETMNADVKFLDPFLNILVTLEQSGPWLTIYLFKWKLYQSPLKKKPGKAFDAKRLLRSASYNHAEVSAAYSLRDPFAMGPLFGAMRLVAPYLPVVSMSIYPDFFSNEAYFSIDANANLNLGQSMLNYIKKKA